MSQHNAIQKKTTAKVYIDPSKVPFELLEMLQPGRIRTADDLTDFSGMVLRAMLAGDIPPQWSKILRDWAGLMFTNIASKGKLEAGGNVNFNLLQVIQNAEKTQAQARREIVNVEPEIVGATTPPLGTKRKKEPPILIELDFSDIED